MNTFVWLVIGFLVLIAFSSMSQGKGKRRSSRTHGQAERLKPVLIPVQQVDGKVVMEIDWSSTFLVIEHAVQIKDYDFARTWLQKFAYTTVNKEVLQSVRDRFKELMTAFASEDPLYNNLMVVILPIIATQPGLLQTALYPQLPAYSDEQIRYALYFAHELGDLTRVKKGRSYQLFGSTQTVYSSPVQTIGSVGPVTLTSRIEINRSPITEEISSLLKKATSQAKEKDYDAAINSLSSAYELMITCSTEWPIKTYFRLARYHHLAGRYEDARSWLQELYDNVDKTADAREHLYKQWDRMQSRNQFAKISPELRYNRKNAIADEIDLLTARQRKIEQRARS